MERFRLRYKKEIRDREAAAERAAEKAEMDKLAEEKAKK